MAEVNRVGMLTGGGDAPGLNGVIRAVATRSINDYGYEVTGIRRGWRGLLQKEQDSTVPLSVDDVRGHAAPDNIRSRARPPSSICTAMMIRSATSGEKSMPPKSGSTRRIGR